MLANKTPDFDTEIAKFTPRQMDAIRLLDSGKIKYLLYGGALGGGKSYLLRWYAIRRLIILYQIFGLQKPVGMLACEDYPSLKDRQLQKISTEVPNWLGRQHQDHKIYGRCFILHDKWGGGVICFRNLDDPSKYQSAEFAFILVDELTKNNYDVFTFLRTRIRWAGLSDVECQFVGGTNPGGVGHGWVKQLWIDKVFSEEWYPPLSDIDYRNQFAFVPSKAEDNPHLNASYWSMLNTLPENLRKPFKEGRWDIFVGQAFPEFGPIHQIKPIAIPDNAPLYMTFDWGFGAPFSLGWWWVDADGRVYRFHEWYGWAKTPNQGLRLTDSQIAEGIVKIEESLIKSRIISNRDNIFRVAGPDCFQKRPDYRGGGQGPSTFEEFSYKGLYLSPGDPSRELKIRQFHERLKIPVDGTLPMMVVYNTCQQFIRTIPDLVTDKNNIEDVDTTGEDHIYDEACHICMDRPITLKEPLSKKSSYDRRIDRLEKGTDQGSWERYVEHQERDTMRAFQGEDRDYASFEDEDLTRYDDGDLVSTVD